MSNESPDSKNEQDQGDVLAISVMPEINQDGVPMIKIAAAVNEVAAAFRFPASKGRLVAKTLHDHILKIVREIELEDKGRVNGIALFDPKDFQGTVQAREQIQRQVPPGFFKDQGKGQG